MTSHYPIHVRFSDVDVYGHVNNVKYFEYLQEARIAMIRRLVAAASFSVVVAQTDVDYVQAAAVPAPSPTTAARRSCGSATAR